MVNSAGNVLLDSFVRPNERVTDFRTRVSGVRPADLRGTPPFDQVQRQVSDLLKGRIVVGHAIENDLEVRGPGVRYQCPCGITVLWYQHVCRRVSPVPLEWRCRCCC